MARALPGFGSVTARGAPVSNKRSTKARMKVLP